MSPQPVYSVVATEIAERSIRKLSAGRGVRGALILQRHPPPLTTTTTTAAARTTGRELIPGKSSFSTSRSRLPSPPLDSPLCSLSSKALQLLWNRHCHDLISLPLPHHYNGNDMPMSIKTCRARFSPLVWKGMGEMNCPLLPLFLSLSTRVR